MARVTVEDCVEKIPNRFDLVIMAAQRARAVSDGAAIAVERDGDKNPVVALREIADEAVPVAEIEESVIRSHQKIIETEEPAEDEVDIESMQRELMGEMPVIDDSERGEDGLPPGMIFEDDIAAMDDEGGMAPSFAADPAEAPQPPAGGADFGAGPQPGFTADPEDTDPAG